MRSPFARYAVYAALFGFCAAPLAFAQERATGDLGTVDKDAIERVLPNKRPYSPYAGRNFPTRPLFGDTHVHTAISMDAGAWGATLLPADAYRFAKGEEVRSNTGQPVRLSRPLDFLVVADHTDNMGFISDFLGGKPELLAVPEGRRWYDMIQQGNRVEATVEMASAFLQGEFPQSLLYSPDSRAYRSTWESIIAAAEAANEPGRFTALIGYEWTSAVRGNNLHRNVIFRDGGDRARLAVPLTVAPPWGSDDPRDLWKWMADYEARTGGQVLAIPHNGNVSNGMMFPVIEPATGKEIDKEYADTRARYEMLVEVTQTKGDGEAHPFLSSNDEFADYETWDKGNLNLSEAKKPEMLEFEYARSALKNGLKLEAKLGTNPYKFGMIGSTDTHTALSAMEEENFFGKTGVTEPSPERTSTTWGETKVAKIMDWEMVSSGYAGVWAAENTREAIFDAMMRKEVYATTGPRMIVRFFGGWEFAAEDAYTRSPGVVGYGKGVPMGSDLSAAPEGKAPSFLVAALKDPIGANLDRIQIIKGWVDASGQTQEKVHDVVWGDADTRRPGTDGKLPPVGNTVNVAEALWTNTIGDPELITVWTDPDFDPSLRAFYYTRVIEIPTPRWTAYDAKRFGLTLPPEVPMVIQERAYTSPIWYTPAGG